jgi:hypothetical protein
MFNQVKRKVIVKPNKKGTYEFGKGIKNSIFFVECVNEYRKTFNIKSVDTQNISDLLDTWYVQYETNIINYLGKTTGQLLRKHYIYMGLKHPHLSKMFEKRNFHEIMLTLKRRRYVFERFRT